MQELEKKPGGVFKEFSADKRRFTRMGKGFEEESKPGCLNGIE